MVAKKDRLIGQLRIAANTGQNDAQNLQKTLDTLKKTHNETLRIERRKSRDDSDDLKKARLELKDARRSESAARNAAEKIAGEKLDLEVEIKALTKSVTDLGKEKRELEKALAAANRKVKAAQNKLDAQAALKINASTRRAELALEKEKLSLERQKARSEVRLEEAEFSLRSKKELIQARNESSIAATAAKYELKEKESHKTVAKKADRIAQAAQLFQPPASRQFQPVSRNTSPANEGATRDQEAAFQRYQASNAGASSQPSAVGTTTTPATPAPSNAAPFVTPPPPPQASTPAFASLPLPPGWFGATDSRGVPFFHHPGSKKTCHSYDEVMLEDSLFRAPPSQIQEEPRPDRNTISSSATPSALLEFLRNSDHSMMGEGTSDDPLLIADDSDTNDDKENLKPAAKPLGGTRAASTPKRRGRSLPASQKKRRSPSEKFSGAKPQRAPPLCDSTEESDVVGWNEGKQSASDGSSTEPEDGGSSTELDE